MEKINIICVDDQPEVLDSVVRDLRPLSKFFRIEDCESAAAATKLIEEIFESGDCVALIVSDHVMPGESGVDFLGKVSKDERFSGTRKILLTGQATLADTIRAINEARIDSYFEKPWKADALLKGTKKLVTEFILEKGIDHRPYMEVLDQGVLLDNLRRG